MTVLISCNKPSLEKAEKYEEALKIIRPLSEKGDMKAQFNLGLMYAKGEGVPQDYKEAVKWWKKAAIQGSVMAQYNLGFMYDDGKGQGVSQDYKEAMKWYTKAAEQGDSQAQFNLGVMYYEEKGISQDYVEAYKWINLAATGNNKLKELRNEIEEKMTKEQIAKAQKLASEFVPIKETK